MICLDTNAVIALLNSRNSRVETGLQDALDRGIAVAMSPIVLFELWYGVAKSARPEHNAGRVRDFLAGPIRLLDFSAEDAEEAAEIRASLERAGTPIGAYDVIIAAQARRRGALLVTANEREFTRVPGLKMENWGSPKRAT
ncbi:MAG TPA: type II toxin-antitoxin system VapC family toxin [Micropepsaceae bacterium]|jgi:tRNA(fMet)-specific endonuclease VapC|nr:type II toxin-antitoxin system VapC family toxin [Micropepsaceae bacterium]